MAKTLLGVLGVILFAAGIVCAGAILINTAGATARDTSDINHGMVIGDPPCDWKVSISDRVMSENETRAVVVNTTNQLGEACKSQIRIAAPGFLITPRSEEQTLAVPPGRSGSVAWVLAPGKTGSFDVVVSDMLSTYALGVRVTDVLGMSAAQARIMGVIGSVLGPMCTFPWWLDKWLQRRKRAERPEAARRDIAGAAPK